MQKARIVKGDWSGNMGHKYWEGQRAWKSETERAISMNEDMASRRKEPFPALSETGGNWDKTVFAKEGVIPGESFIQVRRWKEKLGRKM